jgi:hypothetical protein
MQYLTLAIDIVEDSRSKITYHPQDQLHLHREWTLPQPARQILQQLSETTFTSKLPEVALNPTCTDNIPKTMAYTRYQAISRPFLSFLEPTLRALFQTACPMVDREAEVLLSAA